jgi:multidrug resistance efflux pump
VTDNAFVVENTTSLSSAVSGHIQEIYVQNGQNVKAGDPILRIKPEKYKFEYSGVKAQYDQALVGLQVIAARINVTKLDLKAAQDQLERMKYEYKQKNDPAVSKGIPQIELKTLEYNIKSQADIVASLAQQIVLEQTELKQAQVGIQTLKAASEKAALDLEDTLVVAPADGYIQNLYLGAGSSAVAHMGLFKFVDTANTYIQANFNETDLANVHAGDEVLIFPRTYFGRKVFHGVVMSDNWSVERQHIIPLVENQVIISQNHWLNLPQRLPVQIKVLDNDKNYQLRPGMSAYVYIRTK